MKSTAGRTKVMWITASAAMAFLTLGCGEQKQHAAVQTEATPMEATVPLSPAVIAAASTTTPEAGRIVERSGAISADSLPPDVTAFATDSLIVPGNVVEITAETSTDATSLILTDRVGHKYPFMYDTEAKAWRVHYRVPLRTEIDRLGLSVTATNGANRFKRVWVFLKIQGGVPAESDGC